MMRTCPYEHRYQASGVWVSIGCQERWVMVTRPCTVSPFYRLCSPTLAPLCLHPKEACPYKEER